MAYVLNHPDKVRHVYSLAGLLHPDVNEMDLRHLTDFSASFADVAKHLTESITPNIIEKLHLSDKVSAYSSDGDTTVPLKASEPSWVKNKKRMGSLDHIPTIARTLVRDIHDQLKQLNGAKFD